MIVTNIVTVMEINLYTKNFFVIFYIRMMTLCLNMIVKNEIKIIKRCLDSISDYLDYWVICDTGSTDGTQKFIKNYFKEKNIKGELHQVEWVNFGFNRRQSIQKAYRKADYIILLDADFIANIYDKNFKNKMKEDQYLIKYDKLIEYYNIKLVSGNYKWEYEGVTHEYIYCKTDLPTPTIFDGLTIIEHTDGSNRTLDGKFLRDIKLLEDGIKNEPDNPRYYFYLANSYKDIGNLKVALNYYKKRINMNGYDEEKYLSMHYYAMIKKKLGINMKILIPYFLEAFEYMPTRLESLYQIVKYYRENEDYMNGYKYGKMGLEGLYKDHEHRLFVNKYIENISFPDEVSICSYYQDNFNLSLILVNRIIFNKNNFSRITDNDIKRIKDNKKYIIKKINNSKSTNKLEGFTTLKTDDSSENFMFYSPCKIFINKFKNSNHLETFTINKKSMYNYKLIIIIYIISIIIFIYN